MNVGDSLYVVIDKSGSVRFDHAYVDLPSTPSILLVTVQLATKYTQIFTYGLEEEKPKIWLYADHNSINTNTTFSLEDPTVIAFPELVGWEIFSISNPGRYSFNVTFVKKT